MEPLDTDLEYVARAPRPATQGSRVSFMLIFPLLGFLLILTFILSAIFQWDLSDLIDSLVGLLLLLFFAFIGMMFWAFAPRAEDKA